MQTETNKTTISDRNLSAYLRAKKHSISYSRRANGYVDFSFPESPQLLADIQSFNQNPGIPVLDFLAAQRELTDAIRDHRDRGCR